MEFAREEEVHVELRQVAFVLATGLKELLMRPDNVLQLLLDLVQVGDRVEGQENQVKLTLVFQRVTSKPFILDFII